LKRLLIITTVFFKSINSSGFKNRSNFKNHPLENNDVLVEALYSGIREIVATLQRRNGELEIFRIIKTLEELVMKCNDMKIDGPESSKCSLSIPQISCENQEILFELESLESVSDSDGSLVCDNTFFEGESYPPSAVRRSEFSREERINLQRIKKLEETETRLNIPDMMEELSFVLERRAQN
jgi:hypothetical protein